MWYLIDMDDGIIDMASTKKSLILRNTGGAYFSHIETSGVYSLWSTMDDPEGMEIGYMVRDKATALSNGFDWAFEAAK